MSLVKEYIELTKKYSEEYGMLTIILMQNGAFFEVYALKNVNNNNLHSCQIIDFSRICDLNIIDKRIPSGENMMYDNENFVVNAGFKTHLLDKYIKKLQDNGYTIIVYEEVGDDPIKNSKIRDKTGIYSPGTVLYEDPEQITNNICCLWIERIKSSIYNKYTNSVFIGMGLIDVYTGHSYINEYNEEYVKNPTTFDELERFISIHNPSETIIISNLSIGDINDIVSFINLKSKSVHIVELCNQTNKNTQRALNCEKQRYQTELLQKFYNVNDIAFFMGIFYENVYATQAFCYLLDFVHQHNPFLVHKISEPIFETTSNKLILANHSLKQLNIIDDDNYKGKYSSVSKMLNECITSMGKRKFTHNFLNPISSEDILQREYDIVENIMNDSLYDNHYSFIKAQLSNIKDINKISRQIVMQKVSPKSIYQLYQSFIACKRIYQYILQIPYLTEYLNRCMPSFVSTCDFIDEIMQFIDQVFYIEQCKDIDNISKIDDSFIKKQIDAELDNMIDTLVDSTDQLETCRSFFSKLISDFETSNKKTNKKPKKIASFDDDETESKSFVKIHVTDKNNFSLIATDRRCKILQEVINKHFPNKTCVSLSYTSSETQLVKSLSLSLELEFANHSSSNKTITNNQINLICKNVSSIKTNLIDFVTSVYKRLIVSLQSYHSNISNICDFITVIDMVYCKSHIATKYGYCKPEIASNETNKSFVSAVELRHCLIEKIQQTELYIANDIDIGIGIDSALDGILLYGTNAVGKTSFIRSLGISVIMAQSGLFVPATQYRFKPYKYIFTRILGNDNLFKGLSTFAVEMSELRTILRLADKNSLVLGDELCSGTESISAVSIFVSGVQKLSSVQCSFIFATHLHEIIKFDEITSLHNVGMKHMSVLYDKEKDCLVYNRKLQDGPGNNMYGLEVCKSLNLPEDFLINAHNIRMKYYTNVNSILDGKSSHFNADHVQGGICENCKKNKAVDVHHLMYQNQANKQGIIKHNGLTFKKNNKANLINLCETCHNEIHKIEKKIKKTKTTIGIILEEL